MVRLRTNGVGGLAHCLPFLAAAVVLATVCGGARGASAPVRSQDVCVVVDPLFALGCRNDESTGPQPDQQADQRPPAPVATAQQLNDTEPRITSTKPTYDPRRLAVVARRGTAPETMAALFERAGVTLELSIPQIRAYLVGVEPRRRAGALAQLRASPSVEDANREPLAEALDSGPNDSDWPLQVGLRLAGFPKAWEMTHGSARIVVAVVDSGVDANHPDLRGAVVPGYDFVNSDAQAADDLGHGTAVAGIIAARTDNGQGLAGICWSCSIMPVKVLDATGSGDDTTIAAGVIWAVDHGARVVNLSLGGPGASPQLADALAYATRKGVVVVAAAGNSGSTVPFYPAADPNAISVAGTTPADRAYPWSNFGSWINVSAPGCNIAPVLGGGYGNFCGTSSSTPVVAGLAALAASILPNATPAEIKYSVEHTAVVLPPGVVQYGRIDAPATLSLLRKSALPPPAPQVRSIFRGTLDSRRPTRSYVIDAGEGQLTATLVFKNARGLSLTLYGEDGKQPLGRVAGPSPLRLDRAIPTGLATLVVRWRGTKTSVNLRVAYVRPGQR